MEIPAVVGTKEATKTVKNNDLIIVDGISGDVIIQPSEDEVKAYQKSMKTT